MFLRSKTVESKSAFLDLFLSFKSALWSMLLNSMVIMVRGICMSIFKIIIACGNDRTSATLVCTYCHNPTLALTGSGIAYEQAFKDVFGGAPDRHLTTKVEH